MNNLASTSKSRQNDDFEDDDIFEDSTFLANFENSSFRKAGNGQSNVNNSLNASTLNVSALCCDEEISGYDKLTGKTWIYPTNYPVRDYQFNIIKTAILKNTLVSLPTGLGKTFIAAVIMYNFYRWYPLGKIVFTAPTRPLVAQQIDACYNIIAIPPKDTIEMTGHMQVSTRKTHWQNKRVFFATPQVIYNDLKSGICPGDKIRCLVIDEAHRARRNYAYCQIISALDDIGHKTYRLLALSATPGSKVDDVTSVVKNLHIAHLELRTEDCIDVAPYSHSRKIHTVVIQLGEELTRLRQHYVEILDYYARRLKQVNILPQNLGNLSKGRIVMLYKEYQTKDRSSRHPQHNYIMKDFTVLIALYHGLELLVKHGSRVFLNFFDEHPEKSWIQSDDKLTALLERLRDDLGVNPMSLDTSILPDGTIPEIPRNLCFGHPKFDKLKEIMMEHFSNAKRKGQDTKAIVFCEYRESVNLVHCLLLQCRPLITPQMFVGQGASGKDGKTVVSQKQQLRVMRSFREGACNTLVATCVAEEGLDVGSVDIILCFDISTRSPIRLVQRCGRTGRERGGQVYILVTDGREHQTLLDCMRQRDGLNRKIMQSQEIQNSLYKMNPRMMPHGFTPQCQKMHMNITKKNNGKEKTNTNTEKKGQKNLMSMLLAKTSSNDCNITVQDNGSHTITETEFNDLFPNGYHDLNFLEDSKEYWNMDNADLRQIANDSTKLKLSMWVEWQRTLHKTVNIHHSRDSEILAELLRYSDAKRFEVTQSTQKPDLKSQDLGIQNIPISSPIKSKQTKKKQKTQVKSPVKKYGDIRALFSVTTKSSRNYTKLITDLELPTDGSVPTSLINVLVDMTIDNNIPSKCYVCENVCNCALLTKPKTHKSKPTYPLMFLNDLNLPNIELIDDIDKETLMECKKINNQINISNEQQNGVDNINDCTHNFDLEFDFDSPIVLNSPHKDEIIEEQKVNFDIGDIDDIFDDNSSNSIIIDKEIIKPKEEVKEKEALGFFGLDSIDDIFADSEDDTEAVKSKETLKEININSVYDCNENKIDGHINNILISPKKEPQTIEEYPLSPSILSGSIKPKESPKSPILSTQSRRLQLKLKPKSSAQIDRVKKTLPMGSSNFERTTSEMQSTKSNITIQNSLETTDKSMFTITQLVEIINKTENDKSSKDISNSGRNQNCTIIKRERSVSPILLTQSLIKKASSINKAFKPSPIVHRGKDSLIILDSDSDSNDTLVYDLKTEFNNESLKNDFSLKKEDCPKQSDDTLPGKALNINTMKTPNNGKRKLEIDDKEDPIQDSPYFNKKQKVDTCGSAKPLTLQEKVLAAITSQKLNMFNNNHTVANVAISQPNFVSQKENQNPRVQNHKISNDYVIDSTKKTKLEMLQIFRRDNSQSVKNNFNGSPHKTDNLCNSKLTFDDSDDDFIVDEKYPRTPKRSIPSKSTTTNHKVRKKRKKGNSFLDLEAELSDEEFDSGDELSDNSVGSLADFICDENVSHHENMHAHYLKSVRSPIKGGFKIPQLPNKYNKAELLSQYVEEDTYQMDSFCVDSHIGLTQVNDISDLELAEMALEERRSKKRRAKYCQESQHAEQNGDSPVIKRKRKNLKIQINSDSDDSN